MTASGTRPATTWRHALHELDYLGGVGASFEVDHEWCETQIALGWLRYHNPASDERTGPEVSTAMREIGDRGTSVQRVEHAHLMAALINRESRFRSPDAALRLAQRSLLAARELNDPIVVAAKTFSVGFHLLWQGRLDEAEERLARSAALFADTGAVASAVPALVYRAVVARLRGDADTAERRAVIALEAATEADAPIYAATARANLAWVALRRNDWESARYQSGTALAIWSEREHRTYPFQGLAAWPAFSLARDGHDEATAHELAQRLCAASQQYLPVDITQDLLGGRFDRPVDWAGVRNLT